ncbi:hypothetical protein Dsin_026794 [Dipteronia sinensis]|uniref:BHLH domain-containing protein n=1 Tax=Dipteronia sinensis TaxID=43782 RepID=A0AAE0DZK5_9ROSI|nr:hypothetical protein Dsin_026794 [Dipteronia sinensis]
MNRGSLTEMLHCTDMTVLERQRARLKWQQQDQFHQQQQPEEEEDEVEERSGYFSELSGVFSGQSHVSQVPGFDGGAAAGNSMIGPVKPDPGSENGWSEMVKILVPGFGFPGFEANFSISRTASCPPLAAAAEVKDKMSGAAASGRESFKKRKLDKIQNTKVVVEDEIRDKRLKGCTEEGDSKITDQNNNNSNNNNNNRENSDNNSKENSKVSDVQKPDYIHVRARRGQATDSHSLAERVRREKISERMKYLQDLVPGCNKITGKAGMLDEIINYVQSLQRQVEFLSMKLAAVNPRLDFNIDNFFAKEVFPACPPANFPTIGMSSEMNTNPAYLHHQFNPLQQQQIVSCSGIEMVINPPDMGLRRTISAPVSIPETFLDSSCFTQLQHLLPSSTTWDADLQNFYSLPFDQDRSTTFPSHQPFTGSIEASNLKMEM